jgi:glycosyltransferase involved in cell wall biosynthesis
MGSAGATPTVSSRNATATSQTGAIRLLCLVDVRGWAFDNIYQNVMPSLGQGYEADAVYYLDYNEPGDLLHEILYVRRPDLLHVFLRASLRELAEKAAVDHCAKRSGHSPRTVLADLASLAITTCVYDHSALDARGVAEFAPMLHLYDAYATCSPILHDVYTGIPAYPDPVAVLPDGVNLSLYSPASLERLSETGRPFRIGWVGNSQWGLLEGEIDMKGVEGVLMPGIEELRRRGVDAVAAIVDRSKQWLPREEVARYYNTLDAYVCTSRHEGTPNPVLEAMASGVPVVSTDVGIVRHVAGPLQREFIIDRSPQALAVALQRLLTTPGLREAVSRENMESIKAHTWEQRRDLWLDFFRLALQRNTQVHRARKLDLLQQQLDRPQRGLKRRIRTTLRRYPFLAKLASRVSRSPVLMRAARSMQRLGNVRGPDRPR